MASWGSWLIMIMLRVYYTIWLFEACKGKSDGVCVDRVYVCSAQGSGKRNRMEENIF